MGRSIFVTSLKGGVGKTTVCANLAAVLAKLGYRVLVIDGDFGMRCMDLVLGRENDGLFHCGDVLAGRCSLDDAIISPGKEGIAFLPAPLGSAELPGKGAFFHLFSDLRERYDYILVDSSAELSAYYEAFASACDDALVITLHQTVSVRAAERTGNRLSEMGFRNLRLIVNSYHADEAAEKMLPGLDEIIRRSAIRLLGVLPYDPELPVDQEAGVLAFGGTSRKLHPYEAALFNIAGRITGHDVPLFENVGKTRKRKSYFKNAPKTDLPEPANETTAAPEAEPAESEADGQSENSEKGKDE